MLLRLNLRKDRIEKALEMLSLESPAAVVKEGARWQLTTSKLGDQFWARAERLTALRELERQQMQDYVSLPFGEHMGFLIEALDGDTSLVAKPTLPPLSIKVDAELVEKANTFLRASLSFQPRKQWPTGGMPSFGIEARLGPRSIGNAFQAQPGKALSYWGGEGWGTLVQQGKYRDGRFSDDLVAACIKMIQEWNPQPKPEWVTCVPSLRHPHLVPDFAKRLAKALGLPFHVVITKTDLRPEQKKMANNIQQARNVDGSLALNDNPIPKQAVLLVDDMVDSRWTFTACAWLLRKSGSGEVWPMALVQTGVEE